MDPARKVRILGIETSCDETAVAVVEAPATIVANLVHSQVRLHAEHGGVIPELAGRSHLERILPLVDDALGAAGIDARELGAIAVTTRPGLVGCLLVGLSVAKSLCLALDVPLVGVDHLEAHVHAAFLERPDLPLPLVSLLASGGHTALFLVEAPGEPRLLGRTLDDAAGEALDKAATMLGLGYPGGPAIEEAAAGGDPGALALPRSLLGASSLDFSFSGLKTALLYELRGPGLERPLPRLDEARRSDLAASFEAAVVDCLAVKLGRAVARHAPRSIAIGGGVARNHTLRARLASDPAFAGCEPVFPHKDLCCDNGAMVAGLGALRLAQGRTSELGIEVAARSDVRALGD